MAKVVSKVDPFAVAVNKTSSKKTSDKLVFVAEDVMQSDGSKLYSRQEVVDYINLYIEGKRKEEEAKSAMTTARSPLVGFATFKFAEEWYDKGTRPKNPVITESGLDNDYITVQFKDSESKLDEGSYGNLLSVVGSRLDNYINKYNEFTLNNDVLDELVGNRSVMDLVKEALQEKFAKDPEVLSRLFSVKEVFKTKKGLVDELLNFVKDNKKNREQVINDLVEVISLARVSVALSPTSK